MSSPTFDRSVPESDFRDLPLAALEEIVARFEQRTDAAQQASPPTKEWVKRAVRRQGAARCPVRIKRLSTDVIVANSPVLSLPYSALLPQPTTMSMRSPALTHTPFSRAGSTSSAGCDSLRLEPCQNLHSLAVGVVADGTQAPRKPLGIDLPGAHLRPAVLLDVPAGVHPPAVELEPFLQVAVDVHDLVLLVGLDHLLVGPRTGWP